MAIGLLIAGMGYGQGQDTSFSKEWTVIDSMILKQDLTRSALDRVNQVYRKAKQRRLPAQAMKALLYRISLEERINTDDPVQAIHALQDEILQEKEPVQKAILYTLLARQYRVWFDRNRWSLYNRTPVAGYKPADIQTWSSADFSAAITDAYTKALQDPRLLQQQSLGAYDAIIIKGSGRYLRPTLYDLLAHDALDYYRSDIYTGVSVNPFLMNDPKVFSPANIFIQTTFAPKDTTSAWRALRLFQQLLAFHAGDTDKSALIDADLKRLEWAYGGSVLPDKDILYEAALQQLATQYTSVPFSVYVWYQLALMRINMAGQYDPFGDTTYRMSYNRAHDAIREAMRLFPATDPSAPSLSWLLHLVEKKELSTQTDLTSIPGRPILGSVRYRNTDTMYVRIVRIPYAGYTGYQQEPFNWSSAASMTVYRSFAQPLPATGDHQPHTAMFKIDALPAGLYLLLSSSGKNFDAHTDGMAAQVLQVSRISFIQDSKNFFVLDRQTGQPLASARVFAWRSQWDNKSRKYIRDTVASRITDANGHVRFDLVNGSWNFSFRLGEDTLDNNRAEYISSITKEDTTGNDYEKRYSRVYFFTDRSVYRPGQPVYFKGIAVTRDKTTRQSRIITGEQKEWVYLKDVNNKAVDSLSFTLNEYGSFSGQFNIPAGLLTGRFRLETKNFNRSATSVSVEEYKRPSFEVTVDKAKGSYRLNDTVHVTGSVNAYAGNKVGNAKVVYTVTRNKRFLDFYYLPRRIPATRDRQIASGEITTDAQGRFSIDFRALADDISDSAGSPVFDYNVSINVTDINGETRSAGINIPVGFTSMKLQLGIRRPVSDKDSAQQLTIQTTNYSDEPEPAQVNIKIYRLSAPQKMIRERTLPRPDQFIMGREAFLRDFPSEEYDNELDPATWAREAMVWEKTIRTPDSTLLQLKPGLLEAGDYIVEAVTSDKDGATVKQYRYLLIFDRKAAHPPFPSVNFTYSLSETVEPGKTGSLLSTVPADGTFVISKIKTNTEADSLYHYEHANTGMRTIRYEVTEKDRGGVFINEAFVYDNRVYTHVFFLNVPSPDKQLSVQYETYRDKTEPGSKEKWTVTIRGGKGEPAAAELLTAMYDASLDQFMPHSWTIPPFWPSPVLNTRFTVDGSFMGASPFSLNIPDDNIIYNEAVISRYDRLASNGYELLENRLQQLVANTALPGEEREKYSRLLTVVQNATGIRIRGAAAPMYKNMDAVSNAALNEEVTVGYDADQNKSFNLISNKAQQTYSTVPDIPVQVRKNLTETAFFFPQLHADSSGTYSFSFTMPEALTRWKWMSFAHTKGLATGIQTATIITRKELMVQPNAPRFLREGDNMEFSSKIVNMGSTELKGQATLELIDATTNTSVDGWFQNIFPAQYFTVAPGQSMAVKFPIQVPFSYNRPLTWRIIAKAGNISDGEENTLPVLTNRMLVTESLPLLLKKDTTQSFRFEKLLNNHSESLSQQGITVEYTSNPVWYAVQALPYLIEYPYECSEQSFNRFYGTALASFILNKHPRIRQVLEQWKKDSAAMLGNLQKNEELKQVLLQETPWVMQAENESQQKKNLSLLMDMAKLASQSEIFLQKLLQLQLPNGSFSWFKGGMEDRYITNYILTGIGKLKQLGALTPGAAAGLQPLISRALNYLDSKLAADYDYLIKNKITLSTQHVSGTQVDYLYMRSFFSDIPQQAVQANEYYYGQAKRFWISFNNYYRAQIGLISYRNKETSLVRNSILPALVENASTDTQKGMYWKNTLTSHWYQSPVEYQSMMIAFMSEISRNTKESRITGYINDMKTWLLLNKQTSHWGTTIATADACYAVLLNGSDWLGNDRTVTIRLGNTTTVSNINETQPGTGYFKKRIDGRLVGNEMGNITVSVNTTGKDRSASGTTSPSWGSIYWQYFEDMDKITSASSPLSVTKKLFIEKNTDKGKLLLAVADNAELSVGDRVIIRLEIRSDRDMDYVHLKDTRAASMEPVNVLSSYRWQDGLGYYESTRDTGTDFFFGHLNKGTYVFDYPVYITHTGIFSSGIATIQCMYAPEFTGHSEGMKVRVKE